MKKEEYTIHPIETPASLQPLIDLVKYNQELLEEYHKQVMITKEQLGEPSLNKPKY